MNHSELVFGLVAPIGTDSQAVYAAIEAELKLFNMETADIRLSSIIPDLASDLRISSNLYEGTDELKRIRTRMDEARILEDVFNKRLESCNDIGLIECNSLFAIAACQQIHNQRQQIADNSGKDNSSASLPNRAHVLLTLKRPEEVKLLRLVYGGGFHLLGVYSSRRDRFNYLSRKKHIARADAEALIKDDEDDKQSGGQRTSKAFHLADLFIDVDKKGWEMQINRYLRLLFSHPYISPTKDEQSMYLAFAASIRSAQLGRQVGASISSESGDLLAIGCNEVPKLHGGQYWEGDDPDERDHQLGSDSNDRTKDAILNELIKELSVELGELPEEKLSAVRTRFRATSLFQITEFGRAVHAEMEAILMCARKGVSPKGATLYTTTFPCHNCARHIVGTGIAKVVYIEPYPKSKALELHSDAIRTDSDLCSLQTSSDAISFVPYVGVSPQRYAELFMINPVYGRQVERKREGEIVDWQHKDAELKLPMKPVSYLEREGVAVADFVRIQQGETEKRSDHDEQRANGEA